MPARSVIILSLALPSLATAEPVNFNRDIRPILSDKCFHCHGPDEHTREADLRLDSFEGATEGGEFAIPIVPGKPDESEVMVRILEKDPDEIMPPPKSHKKMTPEEIQLFRQWITEGAKYDEAWTYKDPVKEPTPQVQTASWPVNWVDSFILAGLEKEKLAPSPDADPVTLIRRLHFDLVGLPPNAERVANFVKAANANLQQAVEAEVDHLLASPHFGERLAVYWLDLVRYADTVGYHGDQTHNISPYRDYVINAFNENLSFDQFTREQLAGDLLSNPSQNQIVATGYNRLLQTTHEGGLQPKEYRAIYEADRVRNVSAVWMGATVGCAQCHDHKYDPITMKDHYELGAFFADIDDEQHFKSGTNALPTKRPPEIKVDGRLTMITKALPKPRTVRVLPRGNWLDESGEVVQPKVPHFLPQIKKEGRANRLDLANWLTDVENGTGGLTARVMANRFFYLYFGTGISRSLADFGGQGQPPSNPELLDRLAVEFYESGWDIKHMVKLLTTSRAYRQSSLTPSQLRERDPYNELFARQSRFRLPAEMIRDNALALSGLLVTDIGGASVKPAQPTGYYRHLNFPQRKYKPDTDKRVYRRSVYVHWQRQFLHPMLKAFDAPSREECSAERPRSNTPVAAMNLLNDPSFVEAARVFAERILKEAPKDNRARINHAYQIALSRQPTDEERKTLGRLFNFAEKDFQKHPNQAAELIKVGQTPPDPEHNAVELATWTTLARAIFNLSETTTRN